MMGMIIAALGSGLVFGLGLVISGMTQPSRVLGFLDLFGNWDPTLAIVMASALIVVAPGFALLRRRDASILGATLDWPGRRTIDRSLIGGAVLFGIGWGLVGLCPGPALANLEGLSPKVFGFVLAMAIGARGLDVLQRLRGSLCLSVISAQALSHLSRGKTGSHFSGSRFRATIPRPSQKTICDRAAIQSIVAPR